MDNWMARAACAGKDPNRYAPEGLLTIDLEALRLCDGCPARAECHAWAHDTGSHLWTIHGGELPHQWPFKGTELLPCAWCTRTVVRGARADHDEPPFCNNHCRFMHRNAVMAAARGQASLFEAVPA